MVALRFRRRPVRRPVPLSCGEDVSAHLGAYNEAMESQRDGVSHDQLIEAVLGAVDDVLPDATPEQRETFASTLRDRFGVAFEHMPDGARPTHSQVGEAIRRQIG